MHLAPAMSAKVAATHLVAANLITLEPTPFKDPVHVAGSLHVTWPTRPSAFSRIAY